MICGRGEGKGEIYLGELRTKNWRFYEEVLVDLQTLCILKTAIVIREGIKKNRFLLGKSPKLWVGGGQES